MKIEKHLLEDFQTGSMVLRNWFPVIFFQKSKKLTKHHSIRIFFCRNYFQKFENWQSWTGCQPVLEKGLARLVGEIGAASIFLLNLAGDVSRCENIFEKGFSIWIFNREKSHETERRSLQKNNRRKSYFHVEFPWLSFGLLIYLNQGLKNCEKCQSHRHWLHFCSNLFRKKIFWSKIF